jgi:hypothetical protein
MNVMQMLLDTGLNASGAKLLAESYTKINPKVRAVIPRVLRFTIDRVEMTLRDCTRPTVVCLCGSTRFRKDYEVVGVAEALAGHIVISCQLFQDGAGDGWKNIGEDMKATLDELHKRKIDLADEIVVIDRDGYVGESTRGEIEYAQAQGRRIRYMSKGE